MMKRYFKPRYIVLYTVIIVFGFVPMINMPYEVIVQKWVEEEYVTVEPYTVQEQVVQPYVEAVNQYSDSGRRLPQTFETRVRTVTENVTKYREVTKTRLVTRPGVETRTKRVSILKYLLR